MKNLHACFPSALIDRVVSVGYFIVLRLIQYFFELIRKSTPKIRQPLPFRLLNTLSICLKTHLLALVAHIVLQSISLDPRVARVTQSPATVLDEASLSQLKVAFLAAEASRMPVGVHGLDHAADYEFTCGRLR